MVVMNRYQILGEIMRTTYNICISGMHGKTTTTSMVGSIFEKSGLAHCTLVGGIMKINENNCIIHKDSRWFVVEADESDDSFIKIPRSIGLITNISHEHLDHHLTFENIKSKFLQFIEDLPFYGFAVLCIDDPVVKELVKHLKFSNIYTYSINDPSADFFAKIENFGFGKFNFRVEQKEGVQQIYELNMFGKFNVTNALGAIALTTLLGFEYKIIKDALKNFGSTRRRFEILGKFNGATIIDDYAHHPKELQVTIEAAKGFATESGGKVIAVFSAS